MSSPFARVLLATITSFLCWAPASHAQDYPNHTIELVVPYAPGGSTDTMARIVAPRLSAILKVPVVVNNRPGASGMIGTAFGLQSNDGYRVVVAGNTNLGTLLVAGQKPSYSLDDATGLAGATINPLLIVTKKGRFTDFGAFLKEARANPDTITYATWGPKTPAHFFAELVAQNAGIKLRHIPYDSGSKAALAVLGGQVDVAVATAATAKPFIAAGTMTGLVVGTESKLEDMPSVESIKVLGYPGAVFGSFEGFVTGSKVPADRVAILRQAFEKLLNDPETSAAVRAGGALTLYQSGPQYEEFMRKNLSTLRDLTSKVKMDE